MEYKKLQKTVAEALKNVILRVIMDFTTGILRDYYMNNELRTEK